MCLCDRLKDGLDVVGCGISFGRPFAAIAAASVGRNLGYSADAVRAPKIFVLGVQAECGLQRYRGIFRGLELSSGPLNRQTSTAKTAKPGRPPNLEPLRPLNPSTLAP